MQTKGQIEALAADIVNRFLRRSYGRGATDTSATLTAGALVVHLRGVLTTVERNLTGAEPPGPGRGESMVRMIRDRIVRGGSDELFAGLRDALGQAPAAVLHDVDPISGDEMLVFTFAAAPARVAGPRPPAGRALARQRTELPPVRRRRHPGQLAEQAGEVALGGEAEVDRERRQVDARGLQTLEGRPKPAAIDEPAEAPAGGVSELLGEMAR